MTTVAGVDSTHIAAMAAANRLKVLARLTGLTGKLYLRGGIGAVRQWTDTDIPFRQESFFYYMTGVTDPGYHLAVDIATKSTTLFMPTFSPDHTMWCGAPPSAADLRRTFAVDHVLTDDQLVDTLSSGEGDVHALSPEEAPKGLTKKINDQHLRNAIIESRLIKSKEEIEFMRRAAKISGEAHIALMKSVRPGQGTERNLHALFEYECFRNGAPVQAYTPIVAVGRNGAVLHYVKNNETIPDDSNQLLLVDAGCEYNLYASDITRAYPIGGVFTGDFRTTYEIVLDAQKAVLSAMRVGVEWEDMHRLASRTILAGLVRAGLVQGSTDDLERHHIAARFFPHGLGHSLGIDVHDCGGYPPGVERIPEPGIRYLRMRRRLAAGMVVTVEPGVYFIDSILTPAMRDPTIASFLNIPVIQRFMRTVGGVRIEDDVVILENGIDNLTGWIPKEIDDIERVMASA